MPQVFTNPSALEETIDNVDLSAKQINEAQRLKKKLDSWQSQKQSKIIAYVGRFGSGKSATLKHIESLYEQSKAENKPRWLTFEAWRYADRAKLWDGFVLEVSDALGGHRDRDKIADKIDGLAGVGRYVHKHPLQIFIYATIVWLSASVVVWLALYGHNDTTSLLIKATLKYASPLLLGILALAGVTTLFRQKLAPLTRVEELEKLLDEAIGKLKQPLIIIAEDVDRAGDEGIVFLETLRHFLNTHSGIKHPVIIIAPQDITYMSALNEDKIKGLERSIKIYDEAIYYGSSLIQDGVTTQLMSAAGVKSEYRDGLVLIAGDILRRYKNQLSLRTIKFILREVNEFASSQDSIDARIALLLTAARYIKTANKQGKSMTLLEVFKERDIIHKNTMSSDAIDRDRTFLYDEFAKLTDVSDSRGSMVIVSYQAGKDELLGESKVPGPNNSRGHHIAVVLHERYQALLS